MFILRDSDRSFLARAAIGIGAVATVALADHFNPFYTESITLTEAPLYGPPLPDASPTPILHPATKEPVPPPTVRTPSAKLSEILSKPAVANWIEAVQRPGATVTLVDCSDQINSYGKEVYVGVIGREFSVIGSNLRSIPSIGGEPTGEGIQWGEIVNWTGELEIKEPALTESWLIDPKVIAGKYGSRFSNEAVFAQRAKRNGPSLERAIEVIAGDLNQCQRFPLGKKAKDTYRSPLPLTSRPPF